MIEGEREDVYEIQRDRVRDRKTGVGSGRRTIEREHQREEGGGGGTEKECERWKDRGGGERVREFVTGF